MKRSGPFVAMPLLLASVGCDSEPNDRKHVTGSGVIMRPYEPIPPGTAPRGTAAFRAAVAAPGPAVTLALLQRGRERFETFCTPCHGAKGYGDGSVVQRGHPAPPSYHTERLRAAEPAYIVQVITEGRGAMWPYAERVLPEDRWAIAAYVKALQRREQAVPAAAEPDARGGALAPAPGASP